MVTSALDWCVERWGGKFFISLLNHHCQKISVNYTCTVRKRNHFHGVRQSWAVQTGYSLPRQDRELRIWIKTFFSATTFPWSCLWISSLYVFFPSLLGCWVCSDWKSAGKSTVGSCCHCHWCDRVEGTCKSFWNRRCDMVEEKITSIFVEMLPESISKTLLIFIIFPPKIKGNKT